MIISYLQFVSCLSLIIIPIWQKRKDIVIPDGKK